MGNQGKKQGEDPIVEFGEDGIAPPDAPIEYDPDKPVQQEETLDYEETADTLDVGQDWHQALVELENVVEATESTLASAETTIDSAVREQVVGTGIGLSYRHGSVTPEVCLKVYVNEIAATKSVIASSLPASIGDRPVELEEVGDIIPYSYARRYNRPAPCGVSVGHPRVTAGTLGCLVVLGNNKLCLLSNNHVIANSNDARRGDTIIQPGRVDGGSSPSDRIAVLENFVPITFPGPNTVDAAVAWTAFRFVKRTHVTYRVNPRPMQARLGMSVVKNGRTTQATMGTVTDIGVRIRVGYSGGVAEFRDQVGVRGVGGVFSRGGDSGSLIVTAGSKQPVALLFAGRRDNSITFANPIGAVISALNIREFLGALA